MTKMKHKVESEEWTPSFTIQDIMYTLLVYGISDFFYCLFDKVLILK